MRRVKSQKGITLVALVIYIMVITICVGVLSSISSFFYGNIKKIKDDGKYAAEFDQFNQYFLADVKSNSDVIIQDMSIIFPNGSVYTYNQEDNGIYKGTVKIAKEVYGFTVEKRNNMINNITKNMITVNIIIGKPGSSIFNQKINYVLKYW